MKVLIALNATPECGEIVQEVASRPWLADTQFYLLHVLDPYPFAKAPLSLEGAKRAAESELKTAAKRLCANGFATEVKVVLGRPRERIAKIAASMRADLVVVGSNDPGALTRLLLGSTARAVLRHAPCSVEVVRRRREEEEGLISGHGMKVLVATDGSNCSTAALKSVASRPWPEASEFKVISIPEPFMPLGEFPYMEMKEIESLNAAAIKDAKKYAEAGAEILKKAGLEASPATLLPMDSDAKEIVREAELWQAQMVVLGSHGRRGFDRWTLGSVSEHVAFHAPCSVEVIRGSVPSGEGSKKIRGKE
ncbi:MAG TPA: universal stress protein [Candidatus Acidoferrum sp.]|nr:universal stress protein [Candidatus Acidoferrum sp.]